MRKLYEKDIRQILYGATFLGSGGGGSMKLGLQMLEMTKELGYSLEVNLFDVDEIADDEYAATVCALGSPVAMLDPSKPMFGPDGVYAFKAFQKAFKSEKNREVKYLTSGEMGGHNTFVPIQVAIMSDKDPDKRISIVDSDNNGRACPELNTTLTTYFGYPPTPMGLGSWQGDELAVYPINDKSGEQIARQMCQLYDMRIGFSTWGVNKEDMKKALVPGCISKAQEIGKAYFSAIASGSDIVDELKKVTEVREFCRGTVEKIEQRIVGGFDCGTTVVKGEDGKKYLIDFKNENLQLRDEEGKVYLTAPDGICLTDLSTLEPMTNADVRIGMYVVVTMTPAHENWWNEELKPYQCWLDEIKALGFKGDPVRY